MKQKVISSGTRCCLLISKPEKTKHKNKDTSLTKRRKMPNNWTISKEFRKQHQFGSKKHFEALRFRVCTFDWAENKTILRKSSLSNSLKISKNILTTSRSFIEVHKFVTFLLLRAWIIKLQCVDNSLRIFFLFCCWNIWRLKQFRPWFGHTL